MRCLAAAVVAATAHAAALAGDGFKPPTKDDGVNWMALVTAAIAVIAICVLAFKSARRSHLD